MVSSISDCVLTNAQRLYQAHFNILPLLCDGTRKPRVSWKQYLKHRPAWYQIERYFASLGDPSGIAILCGSTSGNLEVLDIEEGRLFQLLEYKAGTELFSRLVIVKTPSGGFHVYYRCDTIQPGFHVAKNKAGDLLIETLGIGDLVTAPGSPAQVHRLNKPYRIISGDILNVPTITPAERDTILAAARGFNTYIPPARPTANTVVSRTETGLPGADFNIRGDWHEILEPHGWTFLGRTYWRTPGSTGEHNASARDTHLTIFGNGIPGLESNQPYSKFYVYAILNCGGDFAQAARELRAKGFGGAIDYDLLLERIVCPK
jgi:hypothetical protein